MNTQNNQNLYLQTRPNPKLLSLVIPVYNEEESLPYLRDSLEKLAIDLPCPIECILVNDGSKDATSRFLFDWAKEDSRIRVIDLARNFGHQAALTAGLDHANGDAIVAMDADLQDPPKLILKMLEKYREGYDVAFAQRVERHGESKFKLITASIFYWVMKYFVHKELPVNTGDFRLMSREAANALQHLREGQRFLRGMVTWIGFSQIAIPFERPPRIAGETKYPLSKMIKFALDAIVSFSSFPLKVAIGLGIVIFLFGIGYGAYAFLRALIFQDLVPGWATLIVLQSIIGGTILLCLGVIGEYIGRIYEEIKQRPIYIVRRYANLSLAQLPKRGVSEVNSRLENNGTVTK